MEECRVFEDMIRRYPGQVIDVAADGTIVQFQRNICQSLCTEELKEIGCKLSDFWGEEPLFYRKARETGEPQYGERICKCEHNQHPIFYSAIPLEGNKDRILLLGTPLLNPADLEKQKQREITELFLQQFMEIENGVLTMNDKEGNYFYVNETALKVMGKPREEVLGKPVGFYRPGFKPLIMKAMKNRDIVTKLTDYIIDGEQRFYHLTALPIIRGSEMLAGVTIGTDITDRVLMEKKLMDADRMYIIGEMAARIMHDIRNPLQIVKTSAQLLSLSNEKGTMKPAKVSAMLNNINTAVNNVVDLMNDMLQFSKPTCEEKKKQVNLEELLTRLKNLLSSTMEKYRICFNVNVDQECYVLGDEKLLRQGILNIVQNAIDVLQDMDGERRLDLRSWVMNDSIVLEIFNTGPIIEQRIRQRIFDTFFSTKGKEGTGLGLAITKEIVERVHGGQIWCISSQQNQGTSFIIQLPLYTDVKKASQSI